jgi:hypothetical protein
MQPVAGQEAAPVTDAAPAPSSSSRLVVTVVSYSAIIEVANPDERLRPGMEAEVTLRGSRPDSGGVGTNE